VIGRGIAAGVGDDPAQGVVLIGRGPVLGIGDAQAIAGRIVFIGGRAAEGIGDRFDPVEGVVVIGRRPGQGVCQRDLIADRLRAIRTQRVADTVFDGSVFEIIYREPSTITKLSSSIPARIAAGTRE
jgi:hypothetical protein